MAIRPKAALRPAARNIHRELLDAALALMAAAPPEAVSLREVARRARVSPATCYNYFEDKQALFAAVAAEGLGALEAHLAHAGARDPWTGLERLASSYLLFAMRHPTHYRVMLAASEADAGVAEGLAKVLGRLQEAVQAALGQGAEPLEARSRALAIWAQLHGAVEMARFSRALAPDLDVRAHARRVGEAVVALARAADGGALGGVR